MKIKCLSLQTGNTLVFIKEKIRLVIEFSHIQVAEKLLHNMLCYLSFPDNAMPFTLTRQNRTNIIHCLKTDFKEKQEIKKLVNFFETMNVGEYLYVIPYASEYEEEYAMLQESLKYYNADLSEDEICKLLLAYNAQTKQLEKMIDGFLYEVHVFFPSNRKIYFGETNKSKRTCIYCGGNSADKTATFHNEAHAISESLGNRTFFQCEECDACNDYFSQAIEEDFSNYLWKTRLQYGIKGKNGYPTFQLRDKFARYVDMSKTDENWGKFNLLKTQLNNNIYKGPVMIGTEKIESSKPFHIQYIKDYIPLRVYKSLVKFVIGMLDKCLLQHFGKTIQWLREADMIHPLPRVLVADATVVFKEPRLIIFTRKNDDMTLPYCYGDFRIGDKIFVFIVPFCAKDTCDFVEEVDFARFDNECLKIYKKNDNVMLVEFTDVNHVSLDLTLVNLVH